MPLSLCIKAGDCWAGNKMNPLLDNILVAALVLGALGFFAARFFRKKGKGCDSGCGCATDKRKI